MENKKILRLELETEKTLTLICDAALKQAGMQMFAPINQLVSAIETQSESAE